MSYTVEDFDRDFTRDHLHLLSPKELLSGVPMTVALEHQHPLDVLKWFSLEEIKERLTSEGLSPEEVSELTSIEAIFRGYDIEEVKVYLEKRLKYLKEKEQSA
jgi:hypothetical protein